jgi:phosphopentomutase
MLLKHKRSLLSGRGLMRRAIVIVMDGCGVGALPDAVLYGADDPDSATLPHVAEAVGGMDLPNLQRLGLGNIASIRGVAPASTLGGWGKMAEASAGKDSVTGHWEMMGIVTARPFPTYPHGFPPEIMVAFEAEIGRRVLGNVAASGTEILRRLGPEHLATGRPIVYTSADSVFQLAAHEDLVTLDSLYGMCETARALLMAPHDIQRVIARPFTGETAETFRRTENRRDYPLAPPSGSFLQLLQECGKTTHAIGVIADLFPRDLFARAERTQNNPAHLAALLQAVESGQEDFIFANCEDFDMLYGHRNDPQGFAGALRAFDASLGFIIASLRPDDLLVLTSDHGNDPTTSSTDHSREYVPLLVTGPHLTARGHLGTRASFADLAATLAEWLDVSWPGPGASCL